MSKEVYKVEDHVAHGLKVGDVVNYVPHECHAFDHNVNNEYAWAIGQKQPPRMEMNPSTGQNEIVEDVKELDEGFFHRVVKENVNRNVNPAEARKQLVPLYPKKHWKAVVRAVNPDGTVNLDVESNVGIGMITLHYDNVPLDETKAKHHTCHKGGA